MALSDQPEEIYDKAQKYQQTGRAKNTSVKCERGVVISIEIVDGSTTTLPGSIGAVTKAQDELRVGLGRRGASI
jgi:hypothetical protein